MPFALTTFQFDDSPLPDVAGIVLSAGRPLPLSEPLFKVLRRAGWTPMELPISVPSWMDGQPLVATARIGEGGVKLTTRTAVNGGVIQGPGKVVSLGLQ